MVTTRWIELVLGVSLVGPVVAAELGEAEGKQVSWKGEIKFGLTATSGNTETESFNFGLRAENRRVHWRHRFRLDALRSENSGEATAERYLFNYDANYRLNDRGYIFANVRYEQDRFSGFDFQLSETAGYGYVWKPSEKLKLEGQGGGGARQSETDQGVRDDEAIVRGAFFLRWKFSQHAEFRQDLTIEAGESNTLTESITALKSTIIKNFAVSIELNITNNSDPPAGSEKTDTFTSVNLVYNF